MTSTFVTWVMALIKIYSYRVYLVLNLVRPVLVIVFVQAAITEYHRLAYKQKKQTNLFLIILETGSPRSRH